eukprot:7391466-Prymnesium_polylepis.1
MRYSIFCLRPAAATPASAPSSHGVTGIPVSLILSLSCAINSDNGAVPSSLGEASWSRILAWWSACWPRSSLASSCPANTAALVPVAIDSCAQDGTRRSFCAGASFAGLVPPLPRTSLGCHPDD